MSYNVGSIHYDLDLNTSKYDKKQQKVSSGLQDTGKKLAGVGKKFIKYGAIAGGVIAGMTIKGGIDRALNIEDAQAKLKGLGHDTKSIKNIMDSALKSVKGTAYGLDEAATAAASAVAAGVKPGKDLTRVLSLTGDTSTITGRKFNEAGRIINKVLASNRLSMEEINQLQDAGLPILSMLGKQYGKNATEMREMVSKGEVDSKRFLKAIEENISGAALDSGKTIRGSFDNMKAAFSRLGVTLVGDLMPKAKEAIQGLTKWADEASVKFKEWVPRLIEVKDQILEVAKKIGDYLWPKIQNLWTQIKEDLIPALKELWNNYLKPLVPIIGTTLVIALGLFIDTLAFLADKINIVMPILAAFGALLVGSQVLGAITKVKLAVGAQGLTGAIKLLGTKLTAWTGAGGLLINPWTLLAAAAVAAYVTIRNEAKKTEKALKNTNDAVEAGYKMDSYALQRAKEFRAAGNNEAADKILESIRGRAKGGPVKRGTPYIVGENGPELFMPNESGKIMNNQQTNSMSIGTINISDKAEGQYWKSVLDRNQHLTNLGMSAR